MKLIVVVAWIIAIVLLLKRKPRRETFSVPELSLSRVPEYNETDEAVYPFRELPSIFDPMPVEIIPSGGLYLEPIVPEIGRLLNKAQNFEQTVVVEAPVAAAPAAGGGGGGGAGGGGGGGAGGGPGPGPGAGPGLVI